MGRSHGGWMLQPDIWASVSSGVAPIRKVNQLMKRTSLAVALAACSALILAACGSGSSNPLSAESPTGGTSASGAPVVVGSADFSESVLLAEIYAGALKAKGINASTKTNIGSREIYLKALQDGSIQVVPEYTGALALYFDKNFNETDPEKVYAALQKVLPDNLAVLAKSTAEDNDSMVVTKATADRLGATTIEDLAGKSESLTLGAPPEFKTRAQGLPGLEKTYGLTFGTFRELKGQALVQALANDQVQVANIFSTDPAILVNGFVTLTDTKKLFGSQNVVPLVVKSEAARLAPILDPVSAALTTEKLTAMLKETDIDKKDPAAVAAEFLTSNNLG